MRPNLFLSHLFFIFVFLLGGAFSINAQDVKIAGKTVAIFEKGDFLNPKISPDGSRIAYGRQIDKSGTTVAEIWVKNLKTNQAVMMPAARKPSDYNAGAAYVTDISWLDNNRLFASIADSDITSDDVTYNVKTRRIIKKSRANAGSDTDEHEMNEMYVGDEFKPVFTKILAAFPKIPTTPIKSALQTGIGSFLVGTRGAVLQYHFPDSDSHIRLFDLQTKKEKVLLEVTADANNRTPDLLGGFAFGEKIVFAVRDYGKVLFYEHYNNQTKLLLETIVAEDQYSMPSFDVKYQTAERVFMMTGSSSSYKEPKTTVWVYDRDGLKKAESVAKLIDVDIKANLIAYSYWNDEENRHIVVKELKP